MTRSFRFVVGSLAVAVLAGCGGHEAGMTPDVLASNAVGVCKMLASDRSFEGAAFTVKGSLDSYRGQLTKAGVPASTADRIFFAAKQTCPDQFGA